MLLNSHKVQESNNKQKWPQFHPDLQDPTVAQRSNRNLHNDQLESNNHEIQQNLLNQQANQSKASD
jgi:hypothetical protein